MSSLQAVACTGTGRRYLAAGLLVTLAASISACGGTENDSEVLANCAETYTVGFSHPVGEAQFVKAVKEYTAKYGSEKCVNVLLDNTTANSLESQRSTIENWVTQQVDAIVLWPVDPSAYTNLMKKAQGQGTKWLTYVASMEGEDGGVGFDAKQEGDTIAADVSSWVKENYPNGGVQAAVTTLTTQPTARGRWEPPLEALSQLNIPVVSKQDCADQTCGLQIAGDALRENPDLRIFVGFNDDSALGAQKAVQNAGLDPDTVYISGHDGSPEGLNGVKDNVAGFRATTAIPVDVLGRSIIDNSLAAISGNGETFSLTETTLVHPDDVEEIDNLLRSLGQ